ncbi:MAG: flagellar biosynthesis anti-sigma factor FlgM [Phycisphaerae bacterium]|jgi:anti-sigma28 factor (negative regulator of flagellin synthesis)
MIEQVAVPGQGPERVLTRSARAEESRKIEPARADPVQADQVELSEAATAAASESIRDELVADIRQRIADGSYTLDDKLETVIGCLQREIFG